MYDVLSNFEQKQQGDKKKSLFWYYFQKVETELMANLNGYLFKKLNIKLYNIHDGLFCSEKYITEDNVNICKHYYEQMKLVFIKALNNGQVEKVKYSFIGEANKDNIINWLKATGTKQDLIDVEDERYFDLYKIAYDYNAGKIKSTRG